MTGMILLQVGHCTTYKEDDYAWSFFLFLFFFACFYFRDYILWDSLICCVRVNFYFCLFIVFVVVNIYLFYKPWGPPSVGTASPSDKCPPAWQGLYGTLPHASASSMDRQQYPSWHTHTQNHTPKASNTVKLNSITPWHQTKIQCFELFLFCGLSLFFWVLLSFPPSPCPPQSHIITAEEGF
jgi:hypothetical protein